VLERDLLEDGRILRLLILCEAARGLLVIKKKGAISEKLLEGLLVLLEDIFLETDLRLAVLIFLVRCPVENSLKSGLE
jgi:hypothetical protein